MAKTFAYKARNRAGKIVSGTVLAEDQMAAAVHIREQGVFITQLQEQGGAVSSINQWLADLSKVSIKDMAILCRQFSTMIDAGVPVVTCLNILIEQCSNQKLKSALQDVYKRVREGETLSRAMSNYPKIFPEIMINMMEAGEVGGVLDEVLDRLASQFEKEYKLNEKVKSAMTYPIVVMVMAVAVVIFIMIYILPQFEVTFKSLHAELPAMTKMLMSISRFMVGHLLLMTLSGLGLIIGFAAAYKKPATRLYLDGLFLKMPVFGQLTRKVAIARFSRTLSTLIKGGVPIIMALDVVKKTMGNMTMTSALANAQRGMKEGMGLSHTLIASNVFTPMVVQMVAIGEESGSLDTMLEKVADFYENDVDDMVSRLSSLLEPMIIGFLGTTIGFIVISIMMPLFDVIGAIH